MKIQAKIKNKMIVPFYGKLAEYLEPYEDKEVTIVINNVKAGKTLPQLKKVHKIISILADELGYYNEEMKFVLKRHITGYDYSDDNKKYLKSFSAYTKNEMMDFIDKLIIFANQNGVNIE